MAEYVYTEQDAANTLLSELPFFFVGMTESEFQSEQLNYAKFLSNGGKSYEYVPLNKRNK